MTITDIMQKVDEERRFPSRFPVRAIFCESLDEYMKLVTRLRGACDCCLNLSDFCSDKYPDKYPKFKNLCKELENNKDKHILLLSVGEYLRMATKFEVYPGNNAQFYGLWTRMENVYSKTRIFIPVFAAKEYFNRAIGDIDERQKVYIWELDGNDGQNYSLKVYSDKFAKSVSGDNVAINIKDWLKNWQDYYKNKSAIVVTAQIENWEKTFGKIIVDIIENPYEYLCNYDHSVEIVKQDSSPENFWTDLMMRVSKNDSLKDAILEALNLKEFNSVAMVSQWDCLAAIEQWYVWLWYQLYTSDEYVSAIIRKLQVDELAKVPEHIFNDIIYYMESHPEWIAQRRGLIKGLNAVSPSKEFFKALDVKEPEAAIELLAARTMEEKAYLIKTICRWLRDRDSAETVEAIRSAIEKIYPELYAYFNTKSNQYGEYTDYFGWYKRKKIINRPVEKPMVAKDSDALDTRAYLMAQYNEKDCISYWIDGLGLEWISLVCHILDINKGDAYTYTSDVARCVLPSATEFNKQWNLNTYESIKRNRLDKISHKGMPDDKDYFLAIANQMQVIAEMVKEAIRQLEEHEYVIITGDHGSSRLAALAFHRDGTIVPKGAKPMELGRICLLKDSPEETDYVPGSALPCVFDDAHYLVMKNYDHFIQPGNAAGGNTDEKAIAGEVHGGFTLEECIVPVIVLRRKNTPIPLKYTIVAKKLEITGGKASIPIAFNYPVQKLEINPDNGLCECIQIDEYTWQIRFTGLTEGEVVLEIIADNKMVNPKKILPVEKRGIAINNQGGGLP